MIDGSARLQLPAISGLVDAIYFSSVRLDKRRSLSCRAGAARHRPASALGGQPDRRYGAWRRAFGRLQRLGLVSRGLGNHRRRRAGRSPEDNPQQCREAGTARHGQGWHRGQRGHAAGRGNGDRQQLANLEQAVHREQPRHVEGRAGAGHVLDRVGRTRERDVDHLHAGALGKQLGRQVGGSANSRRGERLAVGPGLGGVNQQLDDLLRAALAGNHQLGRSGEQRNVEQNLADVIGQRLVQRQIDRLRRALHRESVTVGGGNHFTPADLAAGAGFVILSRQSRNQTGNTMASPPLVR